MTLQDFKDQVAHKRKYKDFDNLLNYCFSIQDPSLAFEVITEAAELYAKEREKEARKLGYDQGFEVGRKFGIKSVK